MLMACATFYNSFINSIHTELILLTTSSVDQDLQKAWSLEVLLFQNDLIFMPHAFLHLYTMHEEVRNKISTDFMVQVYLEGTVCGD